MTLESQAVNFYGAFEVTTGKAYFKDENDAIEFERELSSLSYLHNRHGMMPIYSHDGNDIVSYLVSWKVPR